MINSSRIQNKFLAQSERRRKSGQEEGRERRSLSDAAGAERWTCEVSTDIWLKALEPKRQSGRLKDTADLTDGCSQTHRSKKWSLEMKTNVGAAGVAALYVMGHRFLTNKDQLNKSYLG